MLVEAEMGHAFEVRVVPDSGFALLIVKVDDRPTSVSKLDAEATTALAQALSGTATLLDLGV